MYYCACNFCSCARLGLVRACIGNGRRQHMSKLHDNQLQGARGVCALRALVLLGFRLVWLLVRSRLLFLKCGGRTRWGTSATNCLVSRAIPGGGGGGAGPRDYELPCSLNLPKAGAKWKIYLRRTQLRSECSIWPDVYMSHDNILAKPSTCTVHYCIHVHASWRWRSQTTN